MTKRKQTMKVSSLPPDGAPFLAEISYEETEPGEILRPRWTCLEGPMWNCVALDPGGTTGWCVVSIHEIAMYSDEYKILENISRWSCGQFTGSVPKQIDDLIDLVDAWDDAEVVAEDFLVRTANSSREVLDPVRLTAPLDWWLARGGARAGDEDWVPRALHLQSPSLAMTTVTDARLVDYGMHSLTAGRPHARDALRHALTFARRRKTNLVELARRGEAAGAHRAYDSTEVY